MQQLRPGARRDPHDAHAAVEHPDGGRIAIESDRDDPAAVSAVRAHFRDIAGAFARGDFAIPGVVHDGPVPGTGVMAAKRAAVTHEARDLPRGAVKR